MPVTLPSDVVDEIVNHIEGYSDVLNVALSSKALSSVALPQHLHYRDIRTRLHNPALWSWLSRSDDLRATHIHSLTILPDNDFDLYEMTPNHTYDLRERLPPELTPSESRPFTSDRNLEACRESETSLVSVLKRMSSLQRFRWYRVPRPLLDEGTDNVWSTLHRLGTVRELDIFDGDANEIQVPSIVISDTVCVIKSCTTHSSDNRFNSSSIPMPLQASNYERPYAASLTTPKYLLNLSRCFWPIVQASR